MYILRNIVSFYYNYKSIERYQANENLYLIKFFVRKTSKIIIFILTYFNLSI